MRVRLAVAMEKRISAEWSRGKDKEKEKRMGKEIKRKRTEKQRDSALHKPRGLYDFLFSLFDDCWIGKRSRSFVVWVGWTDIPFRALGLLCVISFPFSSLYSVRMLRHSLTPHSSCPLNPTCLSFFLLVPFILVLGNKK